MHYLGDKRFRILIVDDSELNRDLLSDMLSDTYIIEEAANGREAITLLERHSYDYALVLLDIVMPEMSGFDVLMYMNRCSWSEDLPVIMISSDDAPALIKKPTSSAHPILFSAPSIRISSVSALPTQSRYTPKSAIWPS